MTFRERLESYDKIKDYDFAQKIYANLCNLVWYDYVNDEVIEFSWRSAGGFVAGIRKLGENYMDFYCSGNEGEIDDEIEKLFESWNIVNVKEYYDGNVFNGIKTKTEEERIEEFKKTNPLVVAYNRDKKINNIL
jgi:hypothetical protein